MENPCTRTGGAWMGVDGPAGSRGDAARTVELSPQFCRQLAYVTELHSTTEDLSIFHQAAQFATLLAVADEFHPRRNGQGGSYAGPELQSLMRCTKGESRCPALDTRHGMPVRASLRDIWFSGRSSLFAGPPFQQTALRVDVQAYITFV